MSGFWVGVMFVIGKLAAVLGLCAILCVVVAITLLIRIRKS
jgi:hypothetical protein